MPLRRKPVYSLHKSSGQARVRIDGREVYLPVYGSPESLARYDELILKWLACDPEAARGAGWRFVAIPPRLRSSVARLCDGRIRSRPRPNPVVRQHEILGDIDRRHVATEAVRGRLRRGAGPCLFGTTAVTVGTGRQRGCG